MLNIQNITVRYGGAPVVENFSLAIEAGQIVSLVGESGSGKTTVIRAAMGLLPSSGRVTAGRIALDDVDLLGCSETDWEKLRGEKFSMIFQDSGAMINPVRKIGSQFVEYIRCHEKTTKKNAWYRGVEMLERMGLPDGERIMRGYAFELSGGMRQRVGIAMAMTFKPEFLFADEPTSALDVTTQAEIVRQMIELKDDFGTGIVIVTHNLGVAAYMSDYIVVMKNGHIVETGDADRIIEHPVDDYTKALIECVPTL